MIMKLALKLQQNKSLAFNASSATIEEEMYLTAVKLIYVVNRIDSTDEVSPLAKPTILIFLPGIYEINKMQWHIDESVNIL